MVRRFELRKNGRGVGLGARAAGRRRGFWSRAGYLGGVFMMILMVGLMGVVGVKETYAAQAPKTWAEADQICSSEFGAKTNKRGRCKLTKDGSQKEVEDKYGGKCKKYGGRIEKNPDTGWWLCNMGDLPKDDSGDATGGRSGSANGNQSDGLTGENGAGSTTGGGGTADASSASTDTTGQPTFDEMTKNGSEEAKSECEGTSVKTSILGGGGCVEVGEDGSGIFIVLNVALQVMTYGVGILATLGFVISGYVYLTAKDDASKIQKAKDRILQIVIGVVIYAVFWSFMQFILPGGLFGDGSG